MTVIHNSLPALSSIKTHGYLDMMVLWKKLVEEYNFFFLHKCNPNFTNKGLSKLVELCFGKRLDKSDQISNWELRPLRESQIIYAALDAHCLLEIYNVLADHSAAMDIPFEDICAEIRHIPRISMVSNPTTSNRDNDDYCMNAGASPKYETVYRPTAKPRYHNESNTQSRSVVYPGLSIDSRHDNQKRYDNRNRNHAHLGIIRVINDGRYDHHDNYNRDDKQGRWEDIQDRWENFHSRRNNASISEPAQQWDFDPVTAHSWQLSLNTNQDFQLAGEEGKWEIFTFILFLLVGLYYTYTLYLKK